MDKNEFTLEFLRHLLDTGQTPDYSEQQQAALRGEIPMTMEIFQSCLEACADAGNPAALTDLLDQFPEQGKAWAAKRTKNWRPYPNP